MRTMIRVIGKNAACFFFFVLAALVFAGSAECAWQPYAGTKNPRMMGTPLSTTINDPVGDTFGSGTVQIDIIAFSATFTPTELIVSVSFQNPVSLPDSGQPNALIGYIDLDTDQNLGTGAISHIDIYSPYTSDEGTSSGTATGSERRRGLGGPCCTTGAGKWMWPLSSKSRSALRQVLL